MKTKINYSFTDKNKVWKSTSGILLPRLFENYQAMEKGEKLIYNWFLTVGGRLSGKTYTILFWICLCMLIKNKKIIVYFVRLNDRMLKETRNDFFGHMEQLGVSVRYGAGGNYNANDNTFKYNQNEVYFKTLNHEKIKISSGGIAGLTTHNDADYIIVFFDEITNLNEKLVSQFLQSVRGGQHTQKMIIQAANPWSPENWYIKECNSYLPEDQKELEEKGYQERIFKHPDKKVFYYVMRNNIQTNPYSSEIVYDDLNSWKNQDENWWKIVFLGMAGTIGNTIYAHNLKQMKPVDWNWIRKGEGWFQGGVDWGDGSSAGASPSSCHFGKLSLDPEQGVQVIAEKTIWNNQGYKHTTEEQIDEIIKFYKELWLTYDQVPFRVFVDNAALADFYQMFNAALPKHGLTINEIEFLPAYKSPIDKRIITTNLMICRGWYRIDKEACPDLWMALNNAHWVEQKEEREGFKRVRNHDETHWINSGAEYILDHTINDYQNMIKLK